MKILKPFIFFLVLIFLSCTENTVSKENSQKVENLKTFAKVYGYVKYFHPSDGAAEIDWNSFAIHGARIVEKCESRNELINVLDTLFKPIAPSINFTTSKSNKYDLTIITPENPQDFKPTFWQHSGINIGMDPELRTPYRSSRVDGIINKDYSFVVSKLTMRMEASKYIGKKIKYKSWAKKSDSNSNKGYLRFVLEKSDGTSDLKKENIDDEQWKQYEITANIDSLTASIQLGAALRGKGSVLYDLPQLFYENNGKWIEIPLANQDFEKETSLNEYKTNKWYFEGIGYSCSITNTDSYRGAKSAILEYSGIVEKEKGEKLFDNVPSFGYLIEKEINKGLYLQLPLVLYSNDNGTYPKSDSISLEKLKTNLKEVHQETTELSVRLGNVINTYNVFQHFYPYFDVVDVNWNIELERALNSTIEIQNGQHLRLLGNGLMINLL